MKKIGIVILSLLICLSLLVGCTPLSAYQDWDAANGNQIGQKPNYSVSVVNKNINEKPLIGFKEVSDYIAEHGKLPPNYITKSQARALGWDSKKGNLAEVAPGKSIGGDIFTNREGLLPDAPGRVWREADINYTSGYRGSERIVYSNDGLIYMTKDHYKTFTRIK